MVFSWVVVIFLVVLLYRNMKKLEKAEDVILGYLEYLDKFSKVIEVADKKLNDLDRLGAFKNDDETGFIFEQIKKIQEILNSFRIKK